MNGVHSDCLAKAESVELDEAFLRRVDQAMLLSKQRDPYRRDQVHRAAELEIGMLRNNSGPLDRPPRKDTPGQH